MSARSLAFAILASAVALPAAAQNQSVNPHFLTDVSGWTVFGKPLFEASYDPSQGFNTPGALRIATTGQTNINFVVVRQCLPVISSQVLDFGGKYRFESGHAANLKGFASVLWFANDSCNVGAGLPFRQCFAVGKGQFEGHDACGFLAHALNNEVERVIGHG